MPPEKAEQYLAEDQLVMESAKPLERYAPMVPHVGGPLFTVCVSPDAATYGLQGVN